MTRPPHPLRRRPARRAARAARWGLGLLLLAVGAVRGPLSPPAAVGAPAGEPVVIGILGGARDGRGLAAAEAGARAALGLPGLPEAKGRRVELVVADDRGTEAGLQQALQSLKARKAVAAVALPSSELRTAYAEALRRARLPCLVVGPWSVNGVLGAGTLWHLGPSLTAQTLMAADALRSPLAATSVAVVHEPTALGREWAATLARNRPPVAQDLGAFTWEPGREAEMLAALVARKPDWTYVAAAGRHLEAFVRAWGTVEGAPRCLFPDLARSDLLLGLAREAFAASVVLGGPDPEGLGRVGEGLLTALEQAGAPHDEVGVRAAEAVRRLAAAALTAEGSSLKKVVEALAPETPVQGLCGAYAFEPPGGVRFFPLRLWRVRSGRFEEWPEGLLPTPLCGPPLGFGRVPPAVPGPRGRVGWLTWGEKPVRTIEDDLTGLHLTSGGYDPELDDLVKDEILQRAIRIAYRLFRREADGTPIPGWSWGLALTTERPAEITPQRVWVATVAGDDPDAGGRVTGSGTVAVYSTFLKRTMYEQHRLQPPLAVTDKPVLLGRHRWGADKAADLRAQEVQCLIDGFASAIALTLAHEFGHLCGCGHDTEHPTSIMNVVAGAGAAWADAVWIPSHQRNVTQTLGIEGVEK